jgi:hypothetical protein
LIGVPTYLATESCYPIKLFETRLKLLREYLNAGKDVVRLTLRTQAAADVHAKDLETKIASKQAKMRKIDKRRKDAPAGNTSETEGEDEDNNVVEWDEEWQYEFTAIDIAFQEDLAEAKSAGDHALDRLQEASIRLDAFVRRKQLELQYKWIVLTISSIITVFASWGLMRLAFYATESNRNIEELKAAIIRDDFIPESLTIDEIVSDD